MFEDKEIQVLNDTISLSLSLHSHMILVINIGVHFNTQADKKHRYLNSPSHFNTTIHHVLPILHSHVVASQGRLLVIWLETLPQHYNTSNGYYGGTQTACVPIREREREKDWRNYMVYRTVRDLNLFHIHILPLRDIFVPLFAEHVSGDYIDCTHYCWSPMLHQFLFFQLLRVSTPHLTRMLECI